MSMPLAILVLVTVAYLAFHLWYGGRGKPLSAAEVEHYLKALGERVRNSDDQSLLEDVRRLVAHDDGREFVMQNLARYRSKAMYPAGQSFDDDPRAADRRYGRAIIAPLLRFGNVPIFIAPRIGSFIQPPGADDWHYVAMVRYRSRRDFLRFALAIEREDITVHKWAALEKTQVFPVRPLVSLVFVRAAVALALALTGLFAGLLIRLLPSLSA